MSAYQKFVEDYMKAKPCKDNQKYCQVGVTLCICNEEMEGLYWFYETDQFIIDIHDFYIKKERVITTFPDMSPLMSFCSSYILTANGESFNPYQTLSSNSLYLVDMNRSSKNYKVLLHGNFPYLSVGLNFKQGMIDDALSNLKNNQNIAYSDIFFDTANIINPSLEKLAKAILECKMTSPAAEMFLEAKAKEWLSITLDAFINQNSKMIPPDDEEALENVASYLDDHYALDVQQETLEKIAMMSGTKLKKLFKQKYQISITQYSQRRRMNMAEILLLKSSLDIKDIAESVGYSSHSKFSACYKKFKGIYPKDVKKAASRNRSREACFCTTKIE